MQDPFFLLFSCLKRPVPCVFTINTLNLLDFSYITDLYFDVIFIIQFYFLDTISVIFLTSHTQKIPYISTLHNILTIISFFSDEFYEFAVILNVRFKEHICYIYFH